MKKRKYPRKKLRDSKRLKVSIHISIWIWLIDDKRPKKKQKKDIGARRFIDEYAEEASDDYEEDDDIGDYDDDREIRGQ